MRTRLMSDREIPRLVNSALKIAHIAKSGLYYSRDDHDKARFTSILDASVELINIVGRVEPNAMPVALSAADGLWSLPGGWCDSHKTPMEAAAIEAQEEAGITPRNLEYCGYFDQRVLYENPIFHIICHFFVGEAGDPVERKTYPPEISDVGFFTEDSLPPLSMRRVRREEIRRLFAWRRGHRITMFE